MIIQNRLDRLFKEANRLSFNNESKIVLFSDCHRGDGTWADDFARNQNLYFHALNYYYDQDYTYIELGDGDELWENKKLSEIIEVHGNIFYLLSLFHKKNRLYMLYGNHDMVKKELSFDSMDWFYDENEQAEVPLCPGLRFHESLVLEHEESGLEIFLLHGHQADYLNYDCWKLARFLVRYLWRNLELIGVNDPTSAAKNYKRRKIVEKRLVNWVKNEKVPMAVGHTHRPSFPKEGETPYFNDGSCVHPWYITCIEIYGGKMFLVNWTYMTKEDGTVYVGRAMMDGPWHIR